MGLAALPQGPILAYALAPDDTPLGHSYQEAQTAPPPDRLALPDAVRTAGDYLHEAIARAPGFGAGHGPVDHMWVLKP